MKIVGSFEEYDVLWEKVDELLIDFPNYRCLWSMRSAEIQKKHLLWTWCREFEIRAFVEYKTIYISIIERDYNKTILRLLGELFEKECFIVTAEV